MSSERPDGLVCTSERVLRMRPSSLVRARVREAEAERPRVRGRDVCGSERAKLRAKLRAGTSKSV
jgi:hypothetical protein